MNAKNPHRCVFIPEILMEIFERLSAKDTYSAALVCKLWANWAVHTLWRLHSVPFSNLVGLLDLEHVSFRPSFGFVDTTERYHTHPKNQQSVTLSNWNRFVLRSHRIQNLDAWGMWADSSLMEALSLLNSKFGGKVLPNLRHITLSGISLKGDISFPYAFFSATLRSLTLERTSLCKDEVSNNDPLLETLVRQAPNLEVLVLKKRLGVTGFSSFTSFSQLTDFTHVGPMTPRALQSIFHCTNIVNLSLTELTRQCRWSLPPAYTMESVRKLELGFGSDDDSLSDESDVELDDGTIIPSEVSFPFLRELWIEDPRVWILAWLRKIAAESRHVTQLVFQAHASLHQRVLSCLNEFKNLKELIISQRSKGLRAIRGHKLHEWLSKLPHIELFRWTLPELDEVPVLQYVDRRRYLSFGDLAQLLKICSRIRILSVPLQAYEPSDQLLLGKASNNASTISTELSSLTLDIFNLKNAEFKQCARKLVHLLPSGVNLNIKLRPIGEGDSYLCEVSREVINLREAKLDYMIQQERKRKESEDKSMEL